MVSYCVNPGCRAQFLYFRRGRLFAAPPDSSVRKIQCYWLCGDCAEHMDLTFEHDQRPVLVYRSNNPEQDRGRPHTTSA
jgi:hypothetical protein